MSHTVEKIGGTSMSDYHAVRENIFRRRGPYGRVFVVSAYGGVTDRLLEHKKSEKPGVYTLFTDEDDEAPWREALGSLRDHLRGINARWFEPGDGLEEADRFIDQRLESARGVLENLSRLCEHGHFALEDHLLTVREMLASIGEAHSARNTAELLRRDGINARFVDLSGWNAERARPLDKVIGEAFEGIDLSRELPIVTGYAHCEEGLMASFDRGYSEMTFSRIAVITGAVEAVIHKEYHLSSADPGIVGEHKVVPIGRTNYDVADQLANLGMEAIHPRAAKGLRREGIPLRVKNTFEPEHAGTLITGDYVSHDPCVEIIAGRRHLHAIELFDQDMVGELDRYEQGMLDLLRRYRARVVTKDINANTVTHYLACNLKSAKRIIRELGERHEGAEIRHRRVSVVSAIGSDMQVPGILSRAVGALAGSGISILAMHQSMRQVDMQFIIDEGDYEKAVASLHNELIEPHDYGEAICAA